MDRNEWGTPQWGYDYLDAEFCFTLDPCATHENFKCARYYTKEDDGLKQSWANSRVFINPPYGRGLLEPWIDKALEEAHYNCLSVLLLPARTAQPWYHRCMRQAREIRFVEGRISYVPPPGVKASQPREDTIIVIVRPVKLVTRRLLVSSVLRTDMEKGAAGNPRARR